MIIRFKKSQLKNLMAFLILFSLFAMFVYAIGTNQVTLNAPANRTWTNQTNYTSGFNVTWTDTDVNRAGCTLYLNDSQVTETNLTDPNNAYWFIPNVSRDNQTLLYMNKTFQTNNSALWYWTIKCCNATDTPACWAPPARAIYADITFPSVTNGSKNFDTNRWINFMPRVEVIANDSGNLFGEKLTCELWNASRVIASANTTNATPVNLTNGSLRDGLYSNLTFLCKDPAGNINRSLTGWNISIDTTNATFAFNYPTPQNGTNLTGTSVTFNVTITETNAQAVLFIFDGGNISMNLSDTTQCNATGPPFSGPFYCNMTNATGPKKDLQIKMYVNDSAGNVKESGVRNFSVDTLAPQFNNVYNWSFLNGVINFSFEIGDVTPIACRAKIIDRDGTSRSNITGTLGDRLSTGNLTCKGSFNISDVVLDGNFTILLNMSDAVNNSNQTTKLGVKVSLFSGWNLITHPDNSTTPIQLCDSIEGCTKVSLFNNTAVNKSFTTYSNSTRSINNNTVIPPGDPVLVYVNGRSYLMGNDLMPAITATGPNASLSTLGWNVLGILNDANISAVLNATNVSDAGAGIGTPITYASWLNSSGPTYYTCRKSLNKCAGTVAIPSAIRLYKGMGVWVLSNSNTTLNRTTAISGG
ncbi:hypothetical protein HY469_03520 [Candidatus Roizmanbacteria bacterium]|nr:hypothetical protein [Candidatus Roizmanbacteria bacterium]